MRQGDSGEESEKGSIPIENPVPGDQGLTVAEQKASTTGGTPSQESFITSEDEEASAKADQLDKDRLLKSQLEAGFKAPISAVENAAKLKKKKPIQHGFFETAQEDAQDTLFLKPLEANKMPRNTDGTPKLDKVFKVAQYRYKGPRTPGPLFDAEHAGRLYVDETTGFILESLIKQVSNGRDKIGNYIGFAVPGSRVLEMADALRNYGGLGNYVFTQEDLKTVNSLASALEKSYADNPHGLIVVKPLKGQTLRQVLATVAHELAHVNQYRLLEENAQKKYPGVKREDRPTEWVILTHDKFWEDYNARPDRVRQRQHRQLP